MLYKYDNRNVTITNWSNKTRHLGQLHGCTSNPQTQANPLFFGQKATAKNEKKCIY